MRRAVIVLVSLATMIASCSGGSGSTVAPDGSSPPPTTLGGSSQLDALAARNEALTAQNQALAEQLDHLSAAYEGLEADLAAETALAERRDDRIAELEALVEILVCGEGGCDEPQATDAILMWPWDDYLTSDPYVDVGYLAPDTWVIEVNGAAAEASQAYSGERTRYEARVPLSPGDNTVEIVSTLPTRGTQTVILRVVNDPDLVRRHGRILSVVTTWPEVDEGEEEDTKVPILTAGVDFVDWTEDGEFGPNVDNPIVEIESIIISPDVIGAFSDRKAYFGFPKLIAHFEELEIILGGHHDPAFDRSRLTQDPHSMVFEITLDGGAIVQLEQAFLGG